MRFFKRLNWCGFRQNHIIIVFTQMLYPPATARHERAGRIMIFFIHYFHAKFRYKLAWLEKCLIYNDNLWF